MHGFDINRILEGALVLLFSIGLHEFAHAKAADMAGDETPRKNGRLSLNPLDHFDIIGGTMILFTLIAGFGIGWGKPVPVNPYNFKHPRWDNLKVSIWGPLTNILLAVAFAAFLRFGGQVILGGDPVFTEIAVMFVYVNLALAFFNLIPIPPLDGSHVLASLLPREKARSYEMFVGRWGLFILIALLATGVLGDVVSKPVFFFSNLLLGYG